MGRARIFSVMIRLHHTYEIRKKCSSIQFPFHFFFRASNDVDDDALDYLKFWWILFFFVSAQLRVSHHNNMGVEFCSESNGNGRKLFSLPNSSLSSPATACIFTTNLFFT